MEYNKAGKVELRKYLIDQGLPEKYLKGKTVGELRQIAEKHELAKVMTHDVLDAVTDEEEGSDTVDECDTQEEEVRQLRPTDPGWTQYVLGQFQDDEVDGEHPRVEGLRRVAELLIGPILDEDCVLVQAPNHENGMTAYVKCSVTFWDNHLDREVRFSALADAGPHNIPPSDHGDFSIFATALADTRGKGRVFRNALKLRRVTAAEEGGKGIELLSGNIATGNGVQLTYAHMLCKRLDIKLEDVVASMNLDCTDSEGKFDPKTLSEEDTMALMRKLNQLNAESGKTSNESK